MTLRRLFLAVSAGVLASAGAAATVRQSPPASGSIAGMVVDDIGTRLNGVTLTLTSTAPRVSREAVSDAAGGFIFDAIVTGTYTLSAAPSPGHAARLFGQVRLEDPGVPIRLTEGQRVDAGMTLPRTGSISGILTDDNGDPAGGSVTASVWVRRNGVRTRLSFAARGVGADGRYRIDNLSPGDYVVSANGPYTGGDVRRMTPALIARAARAVAHPDEPLPPLDPAMAPTFMFVPVFYPNATTEASATPVTVLPGADHGDIDLRLRARATAQIDGVVYDHRGLPVNSAIVALFDAKGVRVGDFGSVSPTDKDGVFHVNRIEPGTYTLLLHHGVRLSGPGEPSLVVSLWGRTEVTAVVGTTAHARVDLVRGVAVTGRIVFEGPSPPPPDLSRVRVNLIAIEGVYRAIATGGSLLSRTDRQGNFTVADVPPGTFSAQVITLDASDWIVRSAIASGQDALDHAFPVEADRGADGLIVTMTNRYSEVRGEVLDTAGQPARSGWIALFPQDKTQWTVPSRRIVSSGLGAAGTFTVRGLPAGTYLAAFAPYPMPAMPLEPAGLAVLVAGATQFTIAEGERKAVTVTVR